MAVTGEQGTTRTPTAQMLEPLRRLVQDVSTAENLEEALPLVVHQVRGALDVDACSVFLRDDGSGEMVLMATEGLPPGCEGRVRLAPGEGLVGFVAERKEPVNLENAGAHPRYLPCPQACEERFHGFLGVPIVHYREVLGVLAAQQRGHRLFNPSEAAFMVAVAAQLAGAIRSARSTGGIARVGVGTSFVQGVAGAPGVAIGTITVSHPLARLSDVPDRPAKDPHAEAELFLSAVERVQDELRSLGDRMSTLLPREERSLFDVFALLLDSKQLVQPTVRRIRAGSWAPAAWRDTVMEHVRAFEQMNDEYLRTRASDLRDIGRRVLVALQSEAREPRRYPEHCVLAGEEITAADLAEVPAGQLAGVLCSRGSVLSHTAILARALGVPAVMGLGDLPIGRIDGAPVVVDGYQGRVYVRPHRRVVVEFERLLRDEEVLAAGLRELRDLPARTPDGHSVELQVNTGLVADIQLGLESGAEGVGLYRTEFPYMIRHAFPSEEELFRNYRHVLAALAPKPVVMRTLDVGGDKTLPYFAIEEDNPFLGWRGIRVTLDHPEIFLVQARAMLKASEGLNNLRILLPMISGTHELEEALHLLHRAWGEVRDEGTDVPMPPIGVLIEIPAAVYQTKELARQVDFLSVGSNDLTQYLLAVDRNNPRVADLYDYLHPAVLQALQSVVRDAHAEGKPASICGEMAGDPAAAILLMAMGFDSLSMNATNLPKVKWMLRQVSLSRAKELLAEVMTIDNPQVIRSTIQLALKNMGLTRMMNPAAIKPY